MPAQSVCSNILQSTFCSWFGKNFSFYNWILASNNLDSLLTLGHGCMTLKDSFHLSLYKQWCEKQRTVMPVVENGQFNCLCHPSMCQTVLHHNTGCRMDYLKNSVLDWHSRVQILTHVLDNHLFLHLIVWKSLLTSKSCCRDNILLRLEGWD